MPYIKLTAKEDVRGVFKKDEVINLDFDGRGVITLVGKNGAGKSTLVNSIRIFKCDNKKCGSESLNKHDNQMLLGNAFNIETDFEKIFVVSSEYDDPLSLNNAYDACMFVDLGGFQTSHISKGQRFQTVFARFIKKNGEQFDEKSLVILDEPDNGFDLYNQTQTGRLPLLIHLKHGCSVLYITHSAIAILKAFDVYNLEKREFVDGKDYIKEVCDLDLIIYKNPQK